AAGVGTPVALVVAESERLSALADEAARLGAAVVLTAQNDTVASLTVPVLDALVAAAERVDPDAVLVSNSIEGRDVAGRYAARTGAALAVDAVGVSRDADGVVAHHSVYGGAFNV